MMHAVKITRMDMLTYRVNKETNVVTNDDCDLSDVIVIFKKSAFMLTNIRYINSCDLSF